VWACLLKDTTDLVVEHATPREGTISPWGTNSRLGETGQAGTIGHPDAGWGGRAEVNWEIST
jgi:hypothetical protein